MKSKQALMTVGIVGLLALLLWGCAGSQPEMQPVNYDAVAASISILGQDLETARAEQTDVLAPEPFRDAQSTYDRARSGLDNHVSPAVIAAHIKESRGYLDKALALAAQVRGLLKQADDAREKALAAGARDLGQPFETMEDRYSKWRSALEDQKVDYAQAHVGEIVQGFQAIELMAIKHHALDAARKLMAQARENDIDEVTPQTYAQAMDQLAAAEKFIENNPYDKPAIDDHAARALFMAQRMMAVAKTCQRLKTMRPEDNALFFEEQLAVLGQALNARDVRNLDLPDQVTALAGDARNLVADNKAGKELNQTYQEQIAAMEKRIAGLQGFSQQQEAAAARLAAERAFNERFDQVQRYFSTAEAEVYKQGNQLVIRMRGIKFPVGQATLTPENFQLLTKVQRAIRTFDPSSIEIEGHTDSTGSAPLNQQLSLARAEAVKAYLAANDPEFADRIKALGFGSDRPLASNATAEGRAINRRIDVRITPGQTP